MTYQSLLLHPFRFVLVLALSLGCVPERAGQAQQNEELDEAFLVAVQRKDLAKIHELLKLGANVNARSRINRNYALQFAIFWPDESLVRLLLDLGADIEITEDGGSTPLMFASNADGPVNTKIVKLLLDRGANAQAGGSRALFNAAREAGPEVVRLLLNKGAEVKARDSEGNTVLMSAVEGDSVEIVRILLDAGVDVKATNENGETALMKASSVDAGSDVRNRIAVVKLLLDRGVDVNAKDKKGKTALLHAAYEWLTEAGGVLLQPQIITALLQRGADVNASDNHGNTSLMTTIQSGSIEGVRILLQRGANVNLRNSEGWTAMRFAKSMRENRVFPVKLQAGIVAMLQKAGANE